MIVCKFTFQNQRGLAKINLKQQQNKRIQLELLQT